MSFSLDGATTSQTKKGQNSRVTCRIATTLRKGEVWRRKNFSSLILRFIASSPCQNGMFVAFPPDGLAHFRGAARKCSIVQIIRHERSIHCEETMILNCIFLHFCIQTYCCFLARQTGSQETHKYRYMSVLKSGKEQWNNGNWWTQCLILKCSFFLLQPGPTNSR